MNSNSDRHFGSKQSASAWRTLGVIAALAPLPACSGGDGGAQNDDSSAGATGPTGGTTAFGTGGAGALGNQGASPGIGASPGTGGGNVGGATGLGGAAPAGGTTGVGGAVVGGAGGTIAQGGAPAGGTSFGGFGSGDDAFDACKAALTPVCRTIELDTAAEMEAACDSLEFIEIPLSNGGTHGPVTIEGGPYGGKNEWNEGAGTEFVNPVNVAEPICLTGGIDLFAEPTQVTDDLKNTRDLDYSLYTIFRPACMKGDETYPVITWANGTCGLTHGYAVLLGTVASHGFVVIASNSTWTNTAPTNTVQLRALDYAEALNADPSSYLYQKLDLDKIGAMGHSQGAAATAAAASDPRIKALILWNAGTSSQKPFLNVGGDRDVGGVTLAGVQGDTMAASQPGAWVWHHQVLETGGNSTGHLVLMEQPERVWEMAVAWWKWQLNGDETAKTMFIGDNCGLCNRDSEFEYGHNALLQ